MKIDLAYAGPLLGVESAAENCLKNGYGGLWTSETKHDPFITLALASKACPGLEVGTGVAVALARNPYSLAQSAWDLAALSGGKFRLGLGSQVKAHIERRFSMTWDRPLAQMREMMQAVRAVFHSFQTGEKLKYEGEYYSHTLLIPNFNPGPLPHPDIPIGLAAVGPKMTSLAAEVADFVLLHPFTNVPFVKKTTMPALQAGLEKSSRETSQLEVVGSVFAFAEGPQAEEFEKIVRDKVAFYGSTPAYFGVLEAVGYGHLGPQLHHLSKQGEWHKMGDLIEDSLLDHFRVRASQDQLFARVRQRFSGLYDRAVLTVPGH